MFDSVRKVINIILALLVSIGAWTYVVYNNDPMTEVKYKDVAIRYTGENTLANRGLGVASTSTDTISVTLRQQRIKTTDISADDISVTADVSEAVEGENGISLKISGPDGTKVMDADVRSISVNVEPSSSVEKDIIVCYQEGSEAGIEPVVTDLTSSRAVVIGAESVTGKIYKVIAPMNPEYVTSDDRNYTTSLVAVDRNGEEIDHLVFYPDEINYKAHSGIIKTVNLVPDVSYSDDGYKRTISCPDKVIIKGSEKDIENINSISTEHVELGYFYQDTEIDIAYVLPEGIQLANDQTPQTMKIKVVKEEKEEETENTEETEDES